MGGSAWGMKVKKWLTIITALCSVLAVVSAIAIGKESNSMRYDISMAVLGSSLLGFIMSITEYFDERQRSMKEFYKQATYVLHQVRQVRLFAPREPVSLILDCFSEESSNQFLTENELGIKLKIDVDHKAKDALKNWIKEDAPTEIKQRSDFDDWVERSYSACIKKSQEDMKRVIDSYIDLSKVDLAPLNSAYDNLDFLVENDTIRNQMALDHILSRLRNYRNLGLKNLHVFYGYDCASFPVAARCAVEMCSELFEYRRETEWDVWYQTGLDEIGDALERFRCEIYFGQKPSVDRDIPVCAFYNVNLLREAGEEPVCEESLEDANCLES